MKIIIAVFLLGIVSISGTVVLGHSDHSIGPHTPSVKSDRAIMAVCDRVNTYATYVVVARNSGIPKSDVLTLLDETPGPDNTPHPQKWRTFMRWIVSYVYQDPASDAAWVGVQVDLKCIELAVRLQP